MTHIETQQTGFKMKVYNLTKHAATESQIKDGAINVPAAQASNESLFSSIPSKQEMHERAEKLMQLAIDAGADEGDSVLIAGAMYFIIPMVEAAHAFGLNPVFSFSQRVAVETRNADDTVSLSYMFNHEGWIDA